jgi:hypothetical protein
MGVREVESILASFGHRPSRVLGGKAAVWGRFSDEYAVLPLDASRHFEDVISVLVAARSLAAGSVCAVLAEPSERLAQALKDETEITKALGTLMRRPGPDLSG